MIDKSVLKEKTAVYHTLGCKLNFAETSALRQQLEELGVRDAEKGASADICIINTCSVTDVADHKCRQTIHKYVRANSGAFVIVVGCYAQLNPDKIAKMEGVDLVIGMEHKGDVIRFLCEKLPLKGIQSGCEAALHEHVAVATKDIRTFVPSCSCGERTRYFLKVQDGCDYYCTYCTIPIARGRSRNGSIASLVKQAEEVARNGGREIVITGVNIGDFGKSTNETFFDLVRALDKVDGIERYRISSIEPNLVTDEIVDYCAQSSSFMPHFHIPLQSGSNEVLSLMHRKYTTEFFAEKIAKIKKVLPDAFIGVDVIVGTRGETDELFLKAKNFIDGLDISQLHVFSYSERPGTKALTIDYVVSPEEKHHRSQQLLAISEEKRICFYRKFVGSERTVLTEHTRGGASACGFTDNYIRVEMPDLKDGNREDNHFVRVRLTGFNADMSALIGVPIK
ncbi:MAG: tRNA (N(6)-L-threonylcarbamoyladenosine(37)-C(2))-methylthiotransferase MtaB [Bacteroidaceae bacterium]